MSTCAAKALAILVRKAEGAWARGSTRGVTLAFTDGSFPDYLDLRSWEEKQAANAFLRTAERAGAITIEWDRLAGDTQVKRLRLADPDVAAEYLGVKPLWRICAEAARALETAGVMAEVRPIYEAWCGGKAPRKLGPDRVADFVDAQRVIAACRAQTGEQDVALRRMSARLFRDSKRIEAVTVALDLLTAGLDAPPRLPEEVWSALGLTKHPQPFLVAGDATLLLAGGETLPVPRPYVGVPPRTVAGLRFGDGCRYVLSVENLTTFNELAEGRGGPLAGLLLYCAGMPAPSFARAYGIVGAALPPSLPLLHWGDIDRGGYRIAQSLAKLARHHGHALRPFQMNPAGITAVSEHRTLPDDEVRDMVRLARDIGWDTEAAGVEATRLAYEQEALPPQLPA